MKAKPTNVKKILCIKLKGIGDVVLSTVIIDNLLNEFPGAVVDFLTEPPSKPALEALPQIREVLLFRKNDTFGYLRLIARLMSARYDLVVDCYSNPRTAALTLLSGARYRAGFPYRGRAYAYNLYGPPERDKYHSAQLHLELLRNIGIAPVSSRQLFGLTPDDERFADDVFSALKLTKDNSFVVSPSGGWPSKKCDAEKFAEITRALIARHKITALVVWGPEDKADAAFIQKHAGPNAVLAPPTTIRQMAALLTRAAFVVANDSGPMHIAAAVGAPVLGLFGPTDPALQGPFGGANEYIRLEELECIGCNLLDCNRRHECFRDLPIDRILQKIDTLIIKNKITVYADEKI